MHWATCVFFRLLFHFFLTMEPLSVLGVLRLEFFLLRHQWQVRRAQIIRWNTSARVFVNGHCEHTACQKIHVERLLRRSYSLNQTFMTLCSRLLNTLNSYHRIIGFTITEHMRFHGINEGETVDALVYEQNRVRTRVNSMLESLTIFEPNLIKYLVKKTSII